MLNLAPFETPPLGRQQERANIPVATTAATTIIRAKEASSSDGTCFHGDLDLSLGISLSHGGSSYDATGCGNKASHGGRQGSCGDDDVRGCVASSGNTTVNVITDGHCGGHVGDLTVGGGWAAAAFMPSPTSFMHPWSLAARQQKAAAEQDRTPPAAYVPSDAARAVPLPSSAVGWPPVHTSRRNIVTSMQMQLAKPAVTIDGPKSTTMHAGGDKKVAAAPTDSTVVATRPPPPPAANMFAKVHMEGYAIGRKINLRAQGSYDSLSRVLTKMTTNFFCPADCSSTKMGEDLVKNDNRFVFLYEDFEGDRMLVGDVPWELFLASAKRLYIVRNPTTRNNGHGEGDKEDKPKEPTNN